MIEHTTCERCKKKRPKKSFGMKKHKNSFQQICSACFTKEDISVYR